MRCCTGAGNLRSFPRSHFDQAEAHISMHQETVDIPLLIVPGLGGSDAGHWQSRWERLLPRRVEQDEMLAGFAHELTDTRTRFAGRH
jgi:hypothetical protein